MKKITKKDYFKMIMEVCKDNTEICNFCEKELTLLEKKKKYVSPKDLQKNKENTIIKNILLNVLDESPKTIKELMNLNNELSVYSSQKLSSVIKTIDSIIITKDRTFKYSIKSE